MINEWFEGKLKELENEKKGTPGDMEKFREYQEIVKE